MQLMTIIAFFSLAFKSTLLIVWPQQWTRWFAEISHFSAGDKPRFLNVLTLRAAVFLTMTLLTSKPKSTVSCKKCFLINGRVVHGCEMKNPRKIRLQFSLFLKLIQGCILRSAKKLMRQLTKHFMPFFLPELKPER